MSTTWCNNSTTRSRNSTTRCRLGGTSTTACHTGLCPTYATALGDAKENRKGRRLSCYRRNPQNWYYVTHFLAHPVARADLGGGARGACPAKMPSQHNSVNCTSIMLHVHAQKRYVVITYNQIASDIIASIQLQQQYFSVHNKALMHGTVTASLLTSIL